MMLGKCKIVFSVIASCVLSIFAAKTNCEDNREPIENPNISLLNNVKPLRYQVYLDPCISDGNFSGYIHIDLLILKAAKNLSLHSENLKFCEEGVYLTRKGKVNETFEVLKPVTNLENGPSSLQDSDEILDFSSGTVQPSGFFYDKANQIVTIKFDELLTSGRYSLEINYMGAINSEAVGVYRRSYKDDDGYDKVMLLTNFFPTSTRRIFPCRDEPDIKTEIYFTMQTSLNYTTIMPATPENCIEYKEGQRWTHFHPTVNISTYQLNFAVVRKMKNITKISANKSYITYAAAADLKSAKLAQNTYAKAMIIIENVTDTNYPLNIFINLVVPEKTDITSSASLGFITTKKTHILYNERSGPQKKKDVVLRASRDIANQWFNYLVTPASWKYMWLNEGLAEYMKYYIADKITPKWRLKEMFVVWELQRRSFIPNKITDSPPLNKIMLDDSENIQCLLKKSVSSRAVGASLIRMMAHFLTEDVLHSGIGNFLRNNTFNSVKPANFWQAVQDTINATNDRKFENINVHEIMESWINTEFYPVINVTRNYTTGSIEVYQIPAVTFFNLTEKNVTNKWWIPINYATQTRPRFNVTFPSHWLKPDMERLVIEDVSAKDWIVFNVQQTGYYRVLYDKENWKRLVSFLNSENYYKISPVNRAQIVNDAVQFSLKRHLDMSVFLDLLTYLRRETDYIPWYNAQFIFSFLNYHLSNTHAYTSLKKFSLHLIVPLVDKIGYKDRPDDNFSTLLLRRISNYWACHFGYEKCWNNATMQLIAYLDKNKSELGTVDLQEWAQCVGLRGANESIWNRMLKKYQDNLSEDRLIYLACSENPAILNHFLNLTVSNNMTIPDRHVLSVFKSICLYPSGDDKRLNLCLNFINHHLDKIMLRLGNATESFTHLLDLLASEIRQNSQLEQLNNILSQKKAAFASAKLSARIKQTESRITVFEQKANYYDPFLKEKIGQLC